jgi:beta-lactamase class A
MIGLLPASTHRWKQALPGKRLLRGVVLPALLCLAPCSFAAQRVCDLAGAQDPVLQEKLLTVAQEQGLGPAAKRGDLAVALLILSDPDHPRLAQINGNEMLYAASLPKIAILLGAAVAIDEGELLPDAALEKDIQDMIRYSCNDCATRVLRQVGHDQLLEILQRPQYAFYDPRRGGGLWVGKEYGPTPAYHRDPLHNLSHGATVFEVSRFYCALQRDELVSPEQDQMMLEALSKPGIRHKFVKALSSHKGLKIFRKSGTWKTYHADSALVRDGDDTYVMVALANSPRGSLWLERLAEPLRRLATAHPTTTASLKSAPAVASISMESEVSVLASSP